MSAAGGATTKTAPADARVFGFGRKSESPETAETRRLRDGFRVTETPETTGQTPADRERSMVAGYRVCHRRGYGLRHRISRGCGWCSAVMAAEFIPRHY